MSSAHSRRPRAVVTSIQASNVKNEEETWTSIDFNKFDWITMQPSLRGPHKVSKRHVSSTSHHWKGRILDFHVQSNGKKLAKVQHVYTSTSMKLHASHKIKAKANYIYPSDCIEWQPLESLTGTFMAYHVHIGQLLFAGQKSCTLAKQGVFFYDSTYCVPKSNTGFGELKKIPPPSIDSLDLPTPDRQTIRSFQWKMHVDIHASLKFTYGSRAARLSWFMPLHVFSYLFSSARLNRTPTMWVCREGIAKALDMILQQGWDFSEGHHRGDFLRCCICKDKMVGKYFISRQTLHLVFPYRRWKHSKGKWEALDSDIDMKEELEINIKVHDGDMRSVIVTEDWNLADVREYLLVTFEDIVDGFAFVVNGKKIRRRMETKMACNELCEPAILSIHQA